MTRVIHTGDTHLGYQQYHRPERREDFLEAFRRVAEDAAEGDVDAVIHAGDLFHDRRPTLSDVMGALSVLRTLEEAGVPFLAVVGNHEAKRDAQWLDLFESLGLARRLGAEPVVIDDVAFYGLDFVGRSAREGLDYAFEGHDAAHAALVSHGLFQPREGLDYAFEGHDAAHAALVSHGLFQPFPHGDWDLREVLSAATVTFDAVLLGDDHTPRTKRLAEPTETWATYCGSTERTSADERDPRGYNLVTFGEGDAETEGADAVDVRRRGIDTREFVFVEVELGPGEGGERVRERVGQHDLAEAVVVVSIAGEGEPVAPAGIEEFADERGALVARVTDRRELADDSEMEVSFADPDEAVRERIRELGLSPAAREIDETVRASKTADSNVADAVEDRISELIEEGNEEAFEAAEDRAEDTEKAGEDASPESQESGESEGSSGPDGAEGDGQVTMGDYT